MWKVFHMRCIAEESMYPFSYVYHCILIVLSDETDGGARSNYHCVELLWKACWSDRNIIIYILSSTWKNKQNTHFFHFVEYYSVSIVEIIQHDCIIACALIVKTHTFSFCWRSQSRIHNRSPPSTAVAYPGILFGGGGSTNSVEDRGQRERGSGGSSPLVRGSGGSCNVVQVISFHIVFFF